MRMRLIRTSQSQKGSVSLKMLNFSFTPPPRQITVDSETQICQYVLKHQQWAQRKCNDCDNTIACFHKTTEPVFKIGEIIWTYYCKRCFTIMKSSRHDTNEPFCWKNEAHYPCCSIVLELLHSTECIINSSQCALTSMMCTVAFTEQQIVDNRSQQAHNVAARLGWWSVCTI